MYVSHSPDPVPSAFPEIDSRVPETMRVPRTSHTLRCVGSSQPGCIRTTVTLSMVGETVAVG
jgi:hypothetical protein